MAWSLIWTYSEFLTTTSQLPRWTYLIAENVSRIIKWECREEEWEALHIFLKNQANRGINPILHSHYQPLADTGSNVPEIWFVHKSQNLLNRQRIHPIRKRNQLNNLVTYVATGTFLLTLRKRYTNWMKKASKNSYRIQKGMNPTFKQIRRNIVCTVPEDIRLSEAERDSTAIPRYSAAYIWWFHLHIHLS